MARPKKGEEGCEEANSKWKATMYERYGGPEGVRKMMQKIGSRGGSSPASRPKGFAANIALARLAGCKGGRISRRRPTLKDDIDDAEAILEEESGRN